MYLPSTCKGQLFLKFLTFEEKNLYADVYVPTEIAGLRANMFLRPFKGTVSQDRLGRSCYDGLLLGQVSVSACTFDVVS
jgi:hypothetical protein